MARYGLSASRNSVNVPLAPLIDITFLLLIFFLLNLRITSPEGSFEMVLPAMTQAGAAEVEPPNSWDISCDFALKVVLLSNDKGELRDLQLGSRSLGGGPAALERLSAELTRYFPNPNSPLLADLSVDLSIDPQLRYEYLIKTISHCTQRLDRETGRVDRLFQQIRFAEPPLKSAA